VRGIARAGRWRTTRPPRRYLAAVGDIFGGTIEMRTHPSFRERRQPFDHLLFFADAGTDAVKPSVRGAGLGTKSGGQVEGASSSTVGSLCR
jgi:hypothetical protein